MVIDPNASIPAQTAPAPNPMPAQTAQTAPPMPAPSVDSNPTPPPNSALNPPAGARAPGPADPTPGQRFSNTTGGDDPMSTHRKVFQMLAGGPTTDYVQTDNGQVAVTHNQKPGDLARHILSSAFSLFAAGAGGALAAKQGRPFQLDPGTSIGGMRAAEDKSKNDAAQQIFKNTGEAQDRFLKAQLNAREQMKSIQEASQFTQQTKINDQAIAAGDFQAVKSRIDLDDTMDKKWLDDMGKAGTHSMSDKNGAPLSWDDTPEGLRAAQEYATQHPDVLHGTHNGDPDSKYLTTIRRNPSTHRFEILDIQPPTVIHLAGVKRDANGQPMKKGGEYVPDGSITDPVTHKPTFLTQDVSSDDYYKMQDQDFKHKLQQAQLAEINTKTIEKAQEGQGWKLYEQGDSGIAKMTAPQIKEVRGTLLDVAKLADSQAKEADAELEKAMKDQLITDESDPKVAAEFKARNEAHEESLARYKDFVDFTKGPAVAGVTPGIKLGNKIIQDAGANLSWPAVDAAIKASNLPQAEQEAAKAKVWNSMTPAQQTAVNSAPVFDSAAWAAANKGKDVEAAKAAAIAKGYQVK